MKRRMTFLMTALLAATLSVSAQDKQNYPFRNPKLSTEERIADLISRLTIEEKVSLMQNAAKGVERLGIPEYNWWNEGLHGVARTSEHTTSFPQAIGMAATFDAPAMKKVGTIISTEGRAIFNEDFKNEKTGKIYRGLTYWSPNINIFRDPRWGRGQETYGEDPYLTGHIAVPFIQGIQGDDPYYYRATACAKHLAVHSGPEPSRGVFDARPTAHDLWDTYLPAFRSSIREGKVAGLMCAYNRLDGTPCCGNDKILTDIVRNQFGFDGYMVSDCGAINLFHKTHKTHASDAEASSDAVLAGTDIECGSAYSNLINSVQRGLISEREINSALARDLRILFRLGFFDPQDIVPYSNIGREVLECQQHKDHALLMARESMVLLKNDRNILPLNENKIKKIALIGPNADNAEVQLGNYNGHPSVVTTVLMSLRDNYGQNIEIDYQPGTSWIQKADSLPSFETVAARAKKSDVIIFVSGISPTLEGEHGDARGEGGEFYGGDRVSIALPRIQLQFLTALRKTGRPIILVNMSGSAVTMPEQSSDAIIQAWYGGQAAGDAITDVIFGKYNPSGRMPVTVYRDAADLPDFTDYSMANRTYRYFKGDVQYPFGYGLSFTTFAYTVENVAEHFTGEKVTVRGTVKNTGKSDGDEVLQLYVKHSVKEGDSAAFPVPICSLKGFQRIFVKQGETREYEFTLTPEDLGLVDERGNLIEKAGEVTIFVGGGQMGRSDGAFTTLKLNGENYNLY